MIKLKLLRKKISSTFTRYLISYLCIFLLPNILLIAFFSYFINAYYKTEIINSFTESAAQKRLVIDDQLKNILNTAKLISDSSEFSVRELRQSPLAWIDAVNKLSSITAINSNIYKIFYYIRDTEDIIFSSSGSYSYDIFFKNVRYTGWKIDDFKKAMNESNEIVIHPSEKVVFNNSTVENVVTIIVPMPYLNQFNNASLIFQILEKDMTGLDSLTAKADSHIMLLLDENRNILASIPERIPESFYGIIGDEPSLFSSSSNYSFFRRNYRSYLSVSAASNVLDWNIVFIEDQKTALKKLNNALDAFSLVFFIASLLVFALIYYFMRINYNPIKNLKKLLINLPISNIDQGSGTDRYGEIEAVGAIVNNLAANNRILADRLDNSKDSINAMLLVKLLKGYFKDQYSFNEAAKNSGIQLSKKYYASAVYLILRNTEPARVSSEVNKILNASTSYNLEIFSIETMEQNQLNLIVGFDQDNPRYLANSLEALFFKDSLIEGCLGLGELNEDTGRLIQSYFQALAALEYKFIRGNNQVISFQEIDNSNSSCFKEYPQEDLELFKAAIISRNSKNFEQALSSLLDYFASEKADLFTARCLFYDIINSLFKTSLNLGLKPEAITSAYPDVFRLKELDTANDFTELVKSIASIIHQRIEDINNQINSRNISEIFEYIDQHALEPNFVMQHVCDHFVINLSNLSHQFKKQTGMNISEYISNIRIEYVKQQLRETNSPFKDIITSIGYSDSSGFIRKFKSVTGMTPGEYKNAFKVKEFK